MKLLKVAWLFVRLCLTAAVLAAPLFGVWLASSLAATVQTTPWLAVAAGLLAFPLLPLAWDWAASRRRARKLNRKKQARTGFIDDLRARRREQLRLGFLDRLMLRTLAVNLVFVGGLLVTSPTTAFSALATRGDWMLDHADGPWVQPTREALLGCASTLEWLHEWTHPNPYADLADPDGLGFTPLPLPTPEPATPEPATPEPATPEPATPEPATPEPATPEPATPSGPQWPAAESLHPLVHTIPTTAEASPATVGRWLAANEPDPTQRAKALHDWVADRISYDTASLDDGSYVRKQSADQVFRARTGVCAGYVNLLVAMGKAADLDFRYVTGDTHGGDDAGHAWASVELDGRWWLLDPTWNAGYVNESGYHKDYGTDWLFTPAEVFGHTHFPDENVWQLRDQPLSRAAFLRQQPLDPAFFREGYRLLSPTEVRQPQGETVSVAVDNPQDRWMSAALKVDGQRQDCRVSRRAGRVDVRCDAPAPGTWEVVLFDNDEQYGRYAHVSSVYVDAVF